MTLEREILGAIAAAPDEAALEAIRVAALGKKGSISELLEDAGRDDARTSARSRPAVQRLARRGRRSDRRAQGRARRCRAECAPRAREASTSRLPPRPEPQGTIHPVCQVLDEITAIFADLGFAVAEGPGRRIRRLQFHQAQHSARSSGAADARHVLCRQAGRRLAASCCARTPRRCRCAPC